MTDSYTDPFLKKDNPKSGDSMKYYRDIKNVMDTQFEEGVLEGSKQRAVEIATELKRLGINAAVIAQSTGLSPEEIAHL